MHIVVLLYNETWFCLLAKREIAWRGVKRGSIHIAGVPAYNRQHPVPGARIPWLRCSSVNTTSINHRICERWDLCLHVLLLGKFETDHYGMPI